jgi:hypothetical protein
MNCIQDVKFAYFSQFYRKRQDLLIVAKTVFFVDCTDRLGAKREQNLV